MADSQDQIAESRRRSNLARIDELLQDLAGGDDTPKGLMREHLEAARSYLLGAMPSEYQFNLDLADGLVSDLDDKDLQDRIRAFLRDQRSAVT